MEYRGEEKMEMLGEEKMNSFDMEEEKVQDKSSTDAHAHVHFAGRAAAGSDLPICISKNGVKHVSLS